MSCDGYVISFMPGSRGRLITNIVYKLANNLSDPIEFTNLNSAHNFINNADTPYLNNINDLVVNKNIRRVFCTHLYPRITWPSNLNVIFINVSSKTLPEVLINAAIKNVFPKLEKQLANEELSDTEKKFTQVYKNLYPELKTDILQDPIQQYQYLKFAMNDGFKHKPLYKDFIDNKVYNGFRLEYEDFFRIEGEQYVTLQRLCDLLKVPYNAGVHAEFEEYDKSKFDLFKKYCPWFLNDLKETQNE